MMRIWKKREKNVWKGLASGIIGGIAASLIMDQFQAAMKKLALVTGQSEDPGSKEQQGQQQKNRQQQQNQKDDGKKEPATVKAAEAISETVLDHSLTKKEKKFAGPAMHYAMGAASGAVYGVAAEFEPMVAVGAGLPFGAAVWLIADEVAVPAFGLSKPPWQAPVSTHAKALASHFVYGLATDVVRRAVRQAL